MVEWKKLGDVANLIRGKVISKDFIRDNEGEYPVYSSQTANEGIFGCIDSYMFDGDYLTWTTDGAYAGTIFRRKGKFNITNVCGLIDITSHDVDQDFLYYWLSLTAKDYVIEGMGNPKLMSNVASTIKTPILPLPEQQRIVGILDTFTSSIENLKEQIAQRRKQYEYYRDQLLDLEGKEGVEIAPIRRIVNSYCTGATPNKGHLEYYESGTIPWLRTQDVKFNEIYEIDSFVTEEAVAKTGVKWIPANCVIVAISGATAGRCAINKIPTTTNQHCLNLEINPKKALYKYVYYCVYNAYSDMISKKQGARGDLNSSIILGITIPVPSLSEQQRIVSILDTFEASVRNLEQQLAQREKQYEYYRNKLLTFE